MITREEVSDTLWKWRYKLSHLHEKTEKTLADFSSDSFESTLKDGEDASSPEAKARSAAAASKDPGPGSSPSVKTFYEGPNSRQNCIDWVDYPPKQLSKSAAKAQDRVAIKVYKVRDADKPVISGRCALKYHMIEVQNPLLVAALDDILKKQDVHLDVNETATFNEPFSALYFAYDDIVAKYKSLSNDDPVRPFMLLFIRLLDDILGETRVKVKNLRASGLVSHKLAWTYFPKDTTVISWGNNCELLCRVIDCSYKVVNPGIKMLVLRCKVLRFNGNAFVWETAELKIAPFAGNKPLTDLNHYPLEFHQDPEGVKRRLTLRGKKVLDYQGLTYCNYEGMAIFQDKEVEKHNVSMACLKNPIRGINASQVNCRILIDVFGYNKHHLAKGVREDADPNSQKNVVDGTGLAAEQGQSLPALL